MMGRHCIQHSALLHTDISFTHCTVLQEVPAASLLSIEHTLNHTLSLKPFFPLTVSAFQHMERT